MPKEWEENSRVLDIVLAGPGRKCGLRKLPVEGFIMLFVSRGCIATRDSDGLAPAHSS